jgi:hypothetical protein
MSFFKDLLNYIKLFYQWIKNTTLSPPKLIFSQALFVSSHMPSGKSATSMGMRAFVDVTLMCLNAGMQE